MNRTHLDYRRAFFLLLTAFVTCCITAVVVLDQTIENWLYLNIPDMFPPSEIEYAYLDPSYYEDVMIPPPLAYERHVRDVEDFEAWSDMVAGSSFLQRVADIPHVEPVMLESPASGVEKFILGDVIVFHASPPPDQDAGRAVLVVPGSGHGAARDIMGIETEYQPYHDEIGLRLAGAGYHAYTLELDGWGLRQKDVGDMCPYMPQRTGCEFHAFKQKLGAYGISVAGIHDAEVAAVLSHVSERHGWVAVAGLSAGAPRALEAALSNRDMVDATVLASGITVTHGWPILINFNPAAAVDPYDMDTTDRLRALAPMPLYVSYGAEERGLYGVGARTTDIPDAVAPVYDMMGTAGSFSYVVHDGAHEYDVDSVIGFLDSH